MRFRPWVGTTDLIKMMRSSAPLEFNYELKKHTVPLPLHSFNRYYYKVFVSQNNFAAYKTLLHELLIVICS